jgi:hypothetical protein
MSLRRTIEGMRPLARAKGTPHQCIYEQPSMEFITVIDMVLVLIRFGDELFREASGSPALWRLLSRLPVTGTALGTLASSQKQFDRHQRH